MEAKKIVKGLLVHIDHKTSCTACPYQDINICFETLINDIAQLIESLYRPQGTWIYKDYDYICSICGKASLESEDYPYLSSYCPFCGAKMEINHE